jgi:hypothetical protein
VGEPSCGASVACIDSIVPPALAALLRLLLTIRLVVPTSGPVRNPSNTSNTYARTAGTAVPLDLRSRGT